MPVFSKREREPQYHYTYDIPPELREKVIFRLRDIAQRQPFTASSGRERFYWSDIVKTFEQEYGRRSLAQGSNSQEQVVSFLRVCKADEFIDVVEFTLSRMRWSDYHFKPIPTHRKYRETDLEYINAKFREHGVGYEFTEEGEEDILARRVGSQPGSEVKDLAINEHSIARAEEPRKKIFEHKQQDTIESDIHDAFISHSTVNKEKAFEICRELEKYEIKAWISERDGRSDVGWPQSIIEAIQSARVFILALSLDSNTSVEVRREVSNAAKYGITIVPFEIEEVDKKEDLDLELSYFITDLDWVDGIKPPFEDRLKELAKRVRSLDQRDSTPRTNKAKETTTIPSSSQDLVDRDHYAHDIPPKLRKDIIFCIEAVTGGRYSYFWPGFRAAFFPQYSPLWKIVADEFKPEYGTPLAPGSDDMEQVINFLRKCEAREVVAVIEFFLTKLRTDGDRYSLRSFSFDDTLEYFNGIFGKYRVGYRFTKGRWPDVVATKIGLPDETKQRRVKTNKQDIATDEERLSSIAELQTQATSATPSHVAQNFTNAVIICGSVTERQADVFDLIQERLIELDYFPILFDLKKPESWSEERFVLALSEMVRFIIVDITDGPPAMQLMRNITSRTCNVPLVPLVRKPNIGPSTLSQLRSEYKCVLPLHWYEDVDELRSSLDEKIIKPAEAKARELVQVRTESSGQLRKDHPH